MKKGQIWLDLIRFAASYSYMSV